MNNHGIVRVFVIGGLTDDKNCSRMLYEASKLLGKHLGGHSGYQIVVCSAHPSSVDAGVIEGFATTAENKPKKVIIHHPNDVRANLKSGESISEQWDALIKKTGLINPVIRESSEARVQNISGFANAFLLCQIRALNEDTDVVIALGGRRNASAAQLLSIARKSFPIIPFAFLGGAAEQEYVRQEASIRSSINDQNLIDALQSKNGVSRILELIQKIQRVHGNHHIFMSYAWKRAAEADYVEAYLRRNPSITLFRDEENIKSGEPISKRIKEQLKKCNVFLVLWCAEYTESPNCYDELHIIHKRKDCITYILRLDDTRPVWPSLRKPRSHDWKEKWIEAKGRKGIAASLNEMLNKLAVYKI